MLVADCKLHPTLYSMLEILWRVVSVIQFCVSDGGVRLYQYNVWQYQYTVTECCVD